MSNIDHSSLVTRIYTDDQGYCRVAEDITDVAQRLDNADDDTFVFFTDPGDDTRVAVNCARVVSIGEETA